MEYIEHNYAASEIEYKNFLFPSINNAIGALKLKKDSQILDAGCGPGATLLPLLKATKGKGNIVGIDASIAHLKHARKLIRAKRLEKKISLIETNLFDKFPFESDTFDLVWLSDVLFPDDTGENTFTILKEVKRVIKPGGRIAIFYGNWLRLHLLGGYSEMEHTISVANEQRKSLSQKWTPELNPENGLKWLIGLQMKNCHFSFHDTTYRAPLSPRIKKYIHWHFKNIYQKAMEFYLESSNNLTLMEAWKDISDPNSVNYLLKKPWYYCRASPMLFVGTKA
jgi:ubiquinone/menaquinone biosynthesis C-methylase UbiE